MKIGAQMQRNGVTRLDCSLGALAAVAKEWKKNPYVPKSSHNIIQQATVQVSSDELCFPVFVQNLA